MRILKIIVLTKNNDLEEKNICLLIIPFYHRNYFCVNVFILRSLSLIIWLLVKLWIFLARQNSSPYPQKKNTYLKGYGQTHYNHDFVPFPEFSYLFSLRQNILLNYSLLCFLLLSDSCSQLLTLPGCRREAIVIVVKEFGLEQY